MNAKYGVEILNSSKYDEYTLRVMEKSLFNTLEIANLYYESDITIWSLPNFLADIRLEEIDDPLFPDQWHLKNTGQGGGASGVDIDADLAWGITTGSSSIIIAIIDGGVEDHEDFHTGQLIPGYTAKTGGDGSQASGNTSAGKHGQAVAGLAAAAFNTEGVRGVTDNVKIMPIRIFDIYGLEWDDIADAIDTAWTRGADILNNSWGVNLEGFYDDDIAAAIYRARTQGRNGKGCLVVKSAGNTGDYVTFPGTVPGVLVVGAVTNEDDPASYTPRDDDVDVVAPSKGGTLGITTMDRMGSNGYDDGNYFSDFGGTSAAAPQVSAIAALILSINGALTQSQVQSIIKNTADDYGSTNWDGYGRVNAYQAVIMTKPLPPTNLYISGYQGGMPRINWTASTSSNVDHYELWWNEVVGPPYGWHLLATTSATFWVDSRVTIDWYGSEDEYGYKALAVSLGDQKSEFSNADYVLVDESPPWGKVLSSKTIPEVYALEGNYPNPFNPTTTIRYDLPEASSVSLVIYDIMGREVRRWLLQESPGYEQIIWDSKDQSGQLAPTGIYIYRFTAASVESDKRFTASRKMLLMK